MNLKLGGSSLAQTLNKLGQEAPDIKDSKRLKRVFSAIQTLIKEKLVLAGHDISSGGMITCLLEMAFPNQSGGIQVDFSQFEEPDLVKILFGENPGLVLQVADLDGVSKLLQAEEVPFHVIGSPQNSRKLHITFHGQHLELEIDRLRDIWYKSSYLLDREQTASDHAKQRYEHYREQPLSYNFRPSFKGTLEGYGLDLNRKTSTGIKAAIIREKGVNGDREMAYCMHLAGFDVKDVHMTDLISGREDLSEVNFIVFVGGFSNSDVLGSAKGWAGAFLYNDRAKNALDAFYAREDTLSLGVCNGCQLMMELGLLYPELEDHPTMHHNDSHKFECGFVNVDILPNNSVMLGSLSGLRLGIWIAHGEGKFVLPEPPDSYSITGKYAYDKYPGNPNGSDYAVACLSSHDGRHTAMMPHLERSLFPWNWAHYPSDRKNDQISPWIEAFVNSRQWIETKIG